VAITPSVSGAALAARGNTTKSVALRGVEPKSFNRIINIASKITAGAFRITGSQAVIGHELADNLGATIGDKIRITMADQRSEVFSISGIFDLGHKELDERWVLVPLRAAQNLFSLIGGVSSIEVKVANIFSADAIANEIAKRTSLWVDNWTKINVQLMAGLRSQDWSQYMVQFFVIFTVALGIASMLVVAVVQKSREIGIMKAVGTSTSLVTRIFLIQGAMVGLLGSILGSVLGAGLSMMFAGLAINPDGSPTFPVDLSPSLFIMAALIATATGLLAALIPACRAARLDPATVIRYG